MKIHIIYDIKMPKSEYSDRKCLKIQQIRVVFMYISNISNIQKLRFEETFILKRQIVQENSKSNSFQIMR